MKFNKTIVAIALSLVCFGAMANTKLKEMDQNVEAYRQLRIKTEREFHDYMAYLLSKSDVTKTEWSRCKQLINTTIRQDAQFAEAYDAFKNYERATTSKSWEERHTALDEMRANIKPGFKSTLGHLGNTNG